ncbi:hypothetical protein QBC47DRAFT_387910 [Echria macrotheca]|uniref:GS catalytic domain-containing protein n=1 Tax=Echria macrotheca TaxID=438768 RepID=A0AAJ0F9I5_9PEZI|nr:hypothetical protein QBC47DRAFT_387910 [Echria macrotheca]
MATSSNAAEALESFTRNHPDTRFIRLQWLDYASTVRGRILTLHHLQELVSSDRYHGLSGLNNLLVDSSVAFNDREGDCVADQGCLIPDFSSLRRCPGLKGHAVVFCNFGTNTVRASPGVPERPQPREACTRRLLQEAQQEAQRMGFGFLVGFEVEFVATPIRSRNNADGQQYAHHYQHQLSGMRTLEDSGAQPVLCEITEALQDVGLKVQHFHAEGSTGQLELAMGPLPPLEAVDALILARETIRRVCRHHSFEASFAPSSPELNGLHLNMSMQQQPRHGYTDAPRDGCSKEAADWFLAGVFAHLDALCGLGMPLPESYDRAVTGRGCCGRFKAWGTQNREVCVRRKGLGFWEFRVLDHAANVYLFVAAVIFAGMDGIRHKAELKIADVTFEPAYATPEKRRLYGVTEELPGAVDQAYGALRADSLLRDKFGAVAIDAYVAVMKEYHRRLTNSGKLGSSARQKWLLARL